MFSGRLFKCPTSLSTIRGAKSRGKACFACLCLTQSPSTIYYSKVGPFTTQKHNILLCPQRLYFSNDREFTAKMAVPPDKNCKLKQPKHSNRLVNSKSPYLLQHAHNPVDWYPWGEEAFEKAQKEDKIIFLSVGYSTCHWCHVMERESFENEEIAKIMNEHFVNIKVDREERPDVDRVYMTFVQACSGGGGWPMSVFLKPDLKPISGGTYFPPQDKFGRPGFKTTLLKWARQWRQNKAHWTRIGESVTEVIRNAAVFEVPMSENLISGKVPGGECWQLCTDQLTSHYEPLFGGFSLAPKFPQPCNLSYLLHVVSRKPATATSVQLTRMVTHTLTMMARGGIHDHIGQGFSRYSTDMQWHVPHFEKMLYDQAQLAAVYSTAYLLTKEPLFRQMADDILTYVCRDLSHKEGGFYSAEDADSYPTVESVEKKEGAFCVWTLTEINALLDKPVPGHPDLRISQLFCHHYGVQPQGNVDPHQDPNGELTGQNVLMETSTVAQTAAKLRLGEEGVSHTLSEARSVLQAARTLRPKPHLDDKILTSWNGLMVSGLARAGEALQDERYVIRAVQAAKFLQRQLYDNHTHRLLRSCYIDPATGGVQHLSPPIEGFLDDYAFMIAGLIDLYEACLDAHWLEWAETLQTTQDKLFWDDGSAGYYSTPHHSNLILRLKEDQDGAEPSGNSVACMNLLRLAAILDCAEYRERAGQLLASFTSRLSNVPMALPHLTSALMLYHDSPTQVIVTGKAVEPDTAALLGVIRSRLVPGRVLMLADEDETSILYRRSELLRRIKAPEVGASAYVCRHHTCSLPVTSAHDLAILLDA